MLAPEDPNAAPGFEFRDVGSGLRICALQPHDSRFYK